MGRSSFTKADSFAILESSRRNGGAVLVTMESDMTDNNGDPHKPSLSASPLVLDVKVRLGRVLLLTAVVTTSVLALVVASRHGVELTRFAASSKTDAERSKLLDDYNSYSGTLAAMVGRPLEVFVALLAQMVVVRFAADSILRSGNVKSRAWLATLLLSAGIGYLLNNALNALNVQLRPLEVRPVISASDLSVIVAPAGSSIITNNRTVTKSEAMDSNPISNTVLRNLVLPREAKAPLTCEWRGEPWFATSVPDDLLEYGLPQRDWQARVLSEAITPQRFRMVVNATNRTANSGVRAADIPMPVSRAANLFMNGLLLMNSFVPVDSYMSYFTRQYANVTIKSNTFASAAVMAGALPPPAMGASDEIQRAWFLNQSQVLFARHVQLGGNMQLRHNDLGLEFTHVSIGKSISFDAVTFEMEMEPALLGRPTNTSNRTYTSTIRKEQCGPWPALCQLPKQVFGRGETQYDPQMQVQAFAICVDATGDETLRASTTYSDGDMYPPTSVRVECDRTSNTSLLVVSVAKKLTADTLVQHASQQNATATNVRKFYSFTVGRLAWELEDLAEVFHAKCGTTSGGCLGLHVDLTDNSTASMNTTSTSSTQAKQQLVVSADALPLAYMTSPNYRYDYGTGMGKQRSLPLVRVHEPPPPRKADPQYDVLAGDILFPHNVNNIQWQTTALFAGCDPIIEDRLQLVLKNHMYMEQSLQPAYTAATFFLLQNGVVQDAISLSANTTSLGFDGNLQDIAVWVSVPMLNAWLTLVGCALLVIAALTVVAWTAMLQHPAKRDPLLEITTPHAIARVVLDHSSFPPLFLRRRVVDEKRAVHDGERLHIDAVSVAKVSTTQI